MLEFPPMGRGSSGVINYSDDTSVRFNTNLGE